MSERTQLIPGYRLLVLSGKVEHLTTQYPTAPEVVDFAEIDALTRYNTTEPDIFRVGDVVFSIQARQAEKVE